MKTICSNCKAVIQNPGNFCASCGNELTAQSSTKHIQCGGYIGYYNLSDWWFNAFTETDRRKIESTYNPMGNNKIKPMTEGHISGTSRSVTNFLWGLASWFLKTEVRHIARCIITKAEETATPNNILDNHFMYGTMVKVYYPDRDNDPTALDKSIYACERQIAMANEVARQFIIEYPNDHLPSHRGYSQLIIIRKKQKDYSEAIRLMKACMAQGWNCDYLKEIAACEKKL